MTERPESPDSPETAEVRRLLAEARLTEPMPADVADRMDDVLAGLRREIRTLPPIFRHVLILRDLEELSSAEVAKRWLTSKSSASKNAGAALTTSSGPCAVPCNRRDGAV